MDRTTPKTSFSLPDLIVRIGAGSPIVSKYPLHYLVETKTSPMDINLHETRSSVTIEPPSRVPLPSASASYDGMDDGFPSEQVHSSQQQSIGDWSRPPRSLSLGDALHLSTARSRSPDTGPEPLRARSLQVHSAESTDVSLQLPRNPFVSPAEPPEPATPLADGTKPQGEATTGTGEGRVHPDYFSVPARLVINPGTPVPGQDSRVTGGLAPDQYLLVAPILRSDSASHSIGKVRFAMDPAQGGPDSKPLSNLDIVDSPLVEGGATQPVLQSNTAKPDVGEMPFMTRLITSNQQLDPRPPAHLPVVRTDPTLPDNQPKLDVDFQTKDDGSRLNSTKVDPEVEKLVAQSQWSTQSDVSHGMGLARAPTEAMATMAKDSSREPLPDVAPSGDQGTDATTPLIPQVKFTALSSGQGPEPASLGPGRRRVLVRKARNVALHPVILKALLGEQLAGPTKKALQALARGEFLGASGILETSGGGPTS